MPAGGSGPQGSALSGHCFTMDALLSEILSS